MQRRISVRAARLLVVSIAVGSLFTIVQYQLGKWCRSKIDGSSIADLVGVNSIATDDNRSMQTSEEDPTFHIPDHRVIVLISFGMEAGKSNLVERCLWSIRRRGHWNGPVLLLTDSPESRYQALVDDGTGTFIVVNPKLEDINPRLKHVWMKYKRFKTYIWNYIGIYPSLSNVTLAYYLDVDVVAGADLSDFFTSIERQYHIEYEEDQEDSEESSRLFFFRGSNPEKFPLQGGQFIAEKGRSEACLEEWRHMIDTNPREQYDQVALRRVLDNAKNSSTNNTSKRRISKCTLHSMEHGNYISFPHSRPLEVMMEHDQFTSLVHIKNSGMQNTDIPDSVQEEFFSAILNMTAKEKDEHKVYSIQVFPDKAPRS